VIIHQAVSPRNDDHIAAIIPSAHHILDAAIDHHIRLVYVSTDMVFDGENAPYDDDATPAPLTPYAAAKAFVEGLLTSALPAECLIVRPSLIYGFDPIDRQTGWLVDSMKSGVTVRLFTDEFRCPIWIDTTALALLELADSPHTGRLNLVGAPLNRWDFGMRLLKYLNLEPTPNVVPSTVAESNLKRPSNLTLLNAKAKRWLKTPILTVDEVGQYQKKK
jgi:dTDP-4-dehydrorhamnose reductase